MSLVEHAERELTFANVEGQERADVLALARIYQEVADGGGSPRAIHELVGQLLYGRTLTPLSSDPREWDMCAPSEWQNVRRSTTFSRDGGKTWYDTQDPTLNNGDVWDREAANWTELHIGNNVRVGSLVRCKLDAYKVGRAVSVNGVPGRVTAIRNGTVAVAHDNGVGYNHMPEVLEVAKT